MALILSLETSSRRCSVALHENGKLLGRAEVAGENVHSSLLTSLIADLMKRTGYVLADLEAVAVGKGPGSYTGLRIGVATAKGLCYALDKPLLAVNTLLAMAWQVQRYRPEADTLLCPLLDARRMEVYAAVFTGGLVEVQPTQALILEADVFTEQLATTKMLFFGDGAAKLQPLLAHQPSALFLNEVFPAAEAVGALATERFGQGAFEDVAYFEPFYLKEFYAGPKSGGSAAKPELLPEK